MNLQKTVTVASLVLSVFASGTAISASHIDRSQAFKQGRVGIAPIPTPSPANRKMPSPTKLVGNRRAPNPMKMPTPDKMPDPQKQPMPTK